MDKALRHQIKMQKYKKRLSQLNLKEGEGRFNCYRTTGKPCSCAVCSPYKYDRAKFKTADKEELEAMRRPTYKYIL